MNLKSRQRINMHQDELWQEFNKAGERLTTGGRSPELGNPKLDEDVFVSTACVWLFRKTQDGIEILFQKRSPQVTNHQNLYDRSAGGHVNVFEHRVDAALREMREEIGASASADELYFIESHTSNFVNMVINTYTCDWTGRSEDFHFDDHEVSRVKWVPLAEIDDFIEKYAKPPIKEDKESLALLKKWLENYGNN